MWKLRTRDENYRPMPEDYERDQHTSKDKALEAAYQLLYGPSRLAKKVLWIEGPNGEKVHEQQIQEWCEKRS